TVARGGQGHFGVASPGIITINTSAQEGNAGAVNFNVAGGINMQWTVVAAGLRGGDVTMSAGADLNLTGAGGIQAGGTNFGGNVVLLAPRGQVALTGNTGGITVNTTGGTQGGAFTVSSFGNVRLGAEINTSSDA